MHNETLSGKKNKQKTPQLPQSMHACDFVYNDIVLGKSKCLRPAALVE
jgi:hypothetical protein